MLSASRILWIDDQPFNNRVESGILHALGVTIDLATTNANARKQLSNAVCDIILSDMHRDDDAGRTFLTEATRAMLSPPIIFYVGQLRDVPQKAFGLTARPDELLHLAFDALEHRRA